MGAKHICIGCCSYMFFFLTVSVPTNLSPRNLNRHEIECKRQESVTLATCKKGDHKFAHTHTHISLCVFCHTMTAEAIV